MKSFSQFFGRSDSGEAMEEGAIRTLSAAALYACIISLWRQTKREREIEKKLYLLASQNSHLAALYLAATGLPQQ